MNLYRNFNRFTLSVLLVICLQTIAIATWLGSHGKSNADGPWALAGLQLEPYAVFGLFYLIFVIAWTAIAVVTIWFPRLLGGSETHETNVDEVLRNQLPLIEELARKTLYSATLMQGFEFMTHWKNELEPGAKSIQSKLESISSEHFESTESIKYALYISYGLQMMFCAADAYYKASCKLASLDTKPLRDMDATTHELRLIRNHWRSRVQSRYTSLKYYTDGYKALPKATERDTQNPEPIEAGHCSAPYA